MSDSHLQGLTAQTSAASTDVIPIADSSTGQLKKITAANLKSSAGSVNFPTSTELTIATGAVTVTQSIHSIDTESDAASDDLDTINFPSNVDLLLLTAANAARTVTLKNSTGNILTATGRDHAIPDNGFVLLYYDGTNAQVLDTGVHLDASGFLHVPSFTDGTRGAAGTAARVIFNTTDGQLNIDDGTNWTLPDGTTT